jgi:hypothetical protein
VRLVIALEVTMDESSSCPPVSSYGGPERSRVASTSNSHSCRDLWLLTSNSPRDPENNMNAVWAARQSGVERVVRLSAVGSRRST